MSGEEGAEDGVTRNADGLTLEEIAGLFKMSVFDLDEGLYGLDTRDVNYGIEIAKARVSREGGLGLGLSEMMAGRDGRGLVLVEDVAEGGNAATTGQFRVGDALSWVGEEPGDMTRVEGLDFDGTLAALGKYADREAVTLVAKRLVRRQPLEVTLVQPDGSEAKLEMLAGSVLRGEMLRQGLQVYDPSQKRFDQPYVTGNCGGEGLCGTCLVAVLEGKELLSPPDRVEAMVLEKRPARYRLSCRTIVGVTNQPGKVVLKSMPTLEG